MAPAARSAAGSAAGVAALLGVMLVLRPGFVVQAAGSALAWFTLLGVLLLVVGTRYLVGRTVGPRAATAAGLIVALTAAALLIGPSFRQRTLNEPLPAALQQPVLTEAPAPATAPSSPSAPATSPLVLSPGPVLTPPAAPRPARAVAPPPAAVAPAPPPRSSAQPEQQLVGELRGIDHKASGQIVLYAGSEGRLVLFDEVDIEGSVGPSVHLVPRGQRRPAGGIRIGDLKAERGSFSYRLPESVDLRQGWTVLVWCDPYDVPIAAADPA